MIERYSPSRMYSFVARLVASAVLGAIIAFSLAGSAVCVASDTNPNAVGLAEPTNSDNPRSVWASEFCLSRGADSGQETDSRTLTNDRLAAELIATGCLLIPLDEGLVTGMSRTPAGQKSDGFTELANFLGDGRGLLPLIGGIYLLGDDEDKETARLALAAFVNAAAVTHGVKMLTGRERPAISGDRAVFHGPSTDSRFMSFPSGHTSVAFAVATVLASRDPKNDWLYYGLAAAVGWARVRKSAHFPSDVLVGAGIGIYSGNNVVRYGPRFLSIEF